MKKYRLPLAKTFFKNHPRAGESTMFLDKMRLEDKKHTIRLNYDLWKKRIDEVNEGKAVLVVYQWDGVPYRSKQTDVFVFEKDEVGIQKLELTPLGWFIDDVESNYTTATIADRDGLTKKDFLAWFKGVKAGTELAIIHFTEYRYKIPKLKSKKGTFKKCENV